MVIFRDLSCLTTIFLVVSFWAKSCDELKLCLHATTFEDYMCTMMLCGLLDPVCLSFLAVFQ